MHLAARRSYRLALSAGVALALGYGLGLAIPFIAPLLAILLGAQPGPPPGAKQTLVLTVFLVIALGIGVVLGPLLQLAPVSALLLVTLGLFFSNRMAIVAGKDAPATLLAFGFTVIPAASCVSQALASAIIATMALSVLLAVVSQWLVYPLFPEDSAAAPPPAPVAPLRGDWLSLRATLVVLPAFLLTLTNPVTYLPLTVKSILLGREASEVSLRNATREMLGSTALGGVFAVALWSLLSLAVNLWFFTGWTILFALYCAARTYGASASRFGPGFWVNTLTTMLILLGAAVQDSANGKDVYQAFAVRMALFIVVTIYAIFAMTLLEAWRQSATSGEKTPC